MNSLLSAVLSDPKTWFGLVGAALLWLYAQIKRAHTAHRKCEVDLAVLQERLVEANIDLAVERGRVDMLTDLFKREAHLG